MHTIETFRLKYNLKRVNQAQYATGLLHVKPIPIHNVYLYVPSKDVILDHRQTLMWRHPLRKNSL